MGGGCAQAGRAETKGDKSGFEAGDTMSAVDNQALATVAVAVNELECKEERALEDCGTMAKENPPLTVYLPWTNHFLYFDFFYVLTGVLLQGWLRLSTVQR